MIILYVLLPLLVLGAESAIDWTKCGENGCYCPSAHDQTLDKQVIQAGVSAANIAENCKQVGLQSKYFTEGAVLFQFHATGNSVRSLALYQRDKDGVRPDKKLFGCKFDENGNLALDMDKDAPGDNQLEKVYRDFKIELFEQRSRINAGSILCAIKVSKFKKLKNNKDYFEDNDRYVTTMKLATSKLTTEYKARAPGAEIFTHISSIKCDSYAFKDLLTSPEYQVLNVINRDKDVMSCVNESYTMRYEVNGERGELDKLECILKGNEYVLSITKKGAQQEDLSDPSSYKIYCAAKFDEVCRDPNDCQPGALCPVYEPGKHSDKTPAKLTCPGNKWLIDGEHRLLDKDPICKRDGNHNRAAFFFKLASGWHKKQGARCFTEFDCKKWSKLIYTCMDETCAMVDDSNGMLKCKDPEKTLTIAYNRQVLNESISYECNTADGKYLNGSVPILPRSRVSCIGPNITRAGRIVDAEVSAAAPYAIVGGAVLGVIALIVIAYFGIEYLRHRKSRVVVHGREAFRKWKRKKRIAYCKKAFSEILLSTAETHANIVAGLNLIDTMLAVEADDRECWEEASEFLRRFQGTIQKVDFPIWHMLSRYLVIQAGKIIEKHGWIAPKRIRKKTRKGLIRTVAIQLLSFAINDNKNAEAEEMIQSGFIKLGFDAVEQYPHCGLLWATIAHTQPLAKQSKAEKPVLAKFNQLHFAENLKTIVQEAVMEVPKADTIPGFESIAQQAAYALGAAPLPRTLYFEDGAGREIFYQKENNEGGDVQRAFFKGLSETGTRVPGQALLIAANMWPNLNTEFMDKVCALAPPSSEWVGRVHHAMAICCYYGRFLDAKRLLNRFVPTAKDADDILSKLSQQQQDFEDAVEKSKEDARAWLAKRTDRDELKQPPVCITNPKIQLDDRIQGDDVKNVDGSSKSKSNRKGSTDREPESPASPASPAPATPPVPNPAAPVAKP